MFEQLIIPSPKQNRSSRGGWDAFFPYYAGYPASFASSLIGSAQLEHGSAVLDPWNGSGTTTQVASKLGYRAIGCDLNPVMVIISRARCIAPADGDSIKPLALKIIDQARRKRLSIDGSDPLLGWFDVKSVESIRCIEETIREYLIGSWTVRSDGTQFERMSSLAATFYVALFSTCRSFASHFQSSNPTWLRRRKSDEQPLAVDRNIVIDLFGNCLNSMSGELSTARLDEKLQLSEPGKIDTLLADSAAIILPEKSVDLVLTSPPYCTRIDYTAATRIELAILSPLLNRPPEELSRMMIGSTRVPLKEISPDIKWGKTCIRFLESVRTHRSKASSGYYLKTHLDYFSKLSSSIDRFSVAMKQGAMAVLVVQDSYYKDVHNNLPVIVSEMGKSSGLRFIGSKAFHLSRSMSGVNPYTRIYERRPGAIESVVVFDRN